MKKKNNESGISKDTNEHINTKIQQRLQQLLIDLQLDDAPAGAALVVYQSGKCIAKASIGMARVDMPWSTDTLSLNFSTGKGVLATLIHVLVSKKMLDYDTPIARYWPTFAANGKEGITLRHVMSHQANLFSIQSIDVDIEAVLDWKLMLEKVALMPITAPEEAALYTSAYSALVYGWVLGGVIELVTQLPLAEALHHYLTEPLGIADSCYFGVPESQVNQVAHLVKHFTVLEQKNDQEQSQPRIRRSKPVLKADSATTLQVYTKLPSYHCWQKIAVSEQMAISVASETQGKTVDDSTSLNTATINRLYFNNSQLNLKNYKSALVLANKQPIDYYNQQTLQAIIPAANGVASAQALATIYAMLANGGKWQGQTLIDQATFQQLSAQQVAGMDAVMPAHMDWRLGYHRRFSICDNNGFHTITNTDQSSNQAFGHMGYNGSVAWCDPARQLSFAFIHNFDVTMLNDIRQFALTEAVLSLIDNET